MSNKIELVDVAVTPNYDDTNYNSEDESVVSQSTQVFYGHKATENSYGVVKLSEISDAIEHHNTDENAHQDIRERIESVNDTLSSEIDTLNQDTDILKTDVQNLKNNKVDKVVVKGDHTTSVDRTDTSISLNSKYQETRFALLGVSTSNNTPTFGSMVVDNTGTSLIQMKPKEVIISNSISTLKLDENGFSIDGSKPANETFVESKIEEHNQSDNAHQDIRQLINANSEMIDSIGELIPEQASQTNQLADKNFVNSTIQTNTANFRGSWANWESVPIHAADYPVDYAGNHIPTVNDYISVQDASDYHHDNVFTRENEVVGKFLNANGQEVVNAEFNYSDKLTIHAGDKKAILTGTSVAGKYYRIHAYNEEDLWLGEITFGTTLPLEGNIPEGTSYLRVSYPIDYADDISLDIYATVGSWRFKYTGAWGTQGKSGWIPEYLLNETPFTAEQLATINSGLTADDKLRIENSVEKEISVDNSSLKIENKATFGSMEFSEGGELKNTVHFNKDGFDFIDNVTGEYVQPKINGEDIGGKVDVDNESITENTDGEIQAVALKGKSITVTDDDIVYGDYDGSVDFESQADYESFVQNGSITKNGKTIYYSETGRYTTPENGGSGGLVIQTTETVQVEGYQVPKLTPEQVTAIYNALASGSTAVVTDPSGNYHFNVDQADNMAGIISCEFKFFNTMYVTYELDNDTVTVTGSLIGGGQWYLHTISGINVQGTDKFWLNIKTKDSTLYNNRAAINTLLLSLGATTSDTSINCNGYHNSNVVLNGVYGMENDNRFNVRYLDLSTGNVSGSIVNTGSFTDTVTPL